MTVIDRNTDRFVRLSKVQLSGASDYADAIEFLADDMRSRLAELAAGRQPQSDEPIAFAVVPDPDCASRWLVNLPDGRTIGRLTDKSKVGSLLSQGLEVKKSEFRSLQGFYADARPFEVRADFIIGHPEDDYVEDKPDDVRSYSLFLAGERFHQSAVGRCAIGDRVRLEHEEGNPFDDRAVAVMSLRGDIIGYLPRDSTFKRAFFDEGKGYTASIKDFVEARGGYRQVVLSLALSGEPIGHRAYPRPAAMRSSDGYIAVATGLILIGGFVAILLRI